MANLQPTILPPSTPTELLQHLISTTTYPTTIIITWPQDQFINALIQDINQQTPQSTDEQATKHHLLRPTLIQTAISRHINIIFTPTVTHLRAYLSTFSASESRIPPPPRVDVLQRPALLMVYGLLEVHRDGMEWSAQGLGFSAATLVEGAMRNGFRAVVVEPRRTADGDELDKCMKENVPVVTGTSLKDDGSWAGPIVAVGSVLGSWFKIDTKRDE